MSPSEPNPDAPGDAVRAELIRVEGRVQGVGFRARAQSLALHHGLRGWVANVGRGVTMHACGSAAQLDGFIDSLERRIGTPARIERVVRTPTDDLPQQESFEIAPTNTPLARRDGG